MLPEAYITHVTKGRVRIKIPSRKGDRAFFSVLKDKLPELSEIPGIQQIEMNPTTGSVLVIHQLDLKAGDLTIIAGYLEQMDLFKLGATDSPGTSISQNIAGTFQEANQQITDFTRGEVDLQSLGVLGLLGLGLFQISRGQVMIPAISALWYAATLLRDQHDKNDDPKTTVNNKEI
jgi:hypothetical protein